MCIRDSCRVYLFRKQGNQMEGSLIGEMDVRNGAGDFATAMKTMHIPTSSLSFFEMDGIFSVSYTHLKDENWIESDIDDRTDTLCIDVYKRQDRNRKDGIIWNPGTA